VMKTSIPHSRMNMPKTSGLRRPRLNFATMKPQLIAIIVMLALCLQGSHIAFAATSPLMPSECQSPSEPQSSISQSCCPRDLHTTSCCLDACLTAVGVTVSPTSLIWCSRTTPALPFHTAIFSSRGDSPLIRPPIL
jgi:hypothetical protein